MLRLLKIEWMKLGKYRAFHVLTGLFILSIWGVNYIVQEAQPSDSMAAMVFGKPFQFPGVWNTVTYVSSFLLFIPGLLMILMMSNEFAFRTHRQNIIDGLSRSQFISVKIAMVFLLAISSTILVFIAACLFGLAEGGSLFSFTGINYILYFFIQSVSYISVALLIALLLKRSAIGVGVYFLYVFVLENAIAGLLNRYAGHSIGSYLPLESSDKLIPIPFLKMMTAKLSEAPDTLYLLVVSSLWIITCLWFCKYKFEKDDL